MINGQLWYTDTVFGILFRRSGYNARVAELTGLAAPTYMAFVEVVGEEPPPLGTIMLVR